MKKYYALIFKCPTCGKVVSAIAFNELARPDVAADLSSEISYGLEHHLVPEVIPNPEKNFDWCDCTPVNTDPQTLF